MSAVIQFMGYAKWWILSKLGRKVPLVNTMGILTNCNLRCRHCSIAQNLDKDPGSNVRLSYEEIVDDLTYRYGQGARIAYFEGGETTLWKDGNKDLGDLIDAAHRIGYYNVGYTTNGTTGRIFTNSDVISVSLDGTREIHDYVRGEGVFDRLMDTLENLDFDGAVYANMVLQEGNLHVIRDVAQLVKDNRTLSGIVFNFLTPPPYDNSPTHDQRVAAVEEIRQLKKEGFPILNSKKGLELLTIDDWSEKCPRYMSAFILPNGEHRMGCPSEGTESCKRCGYAAVREYYLVHRGSPSTILEMSSIFAMGKRKG